MSTTSQLKKRSQRLERFGFTFNEGGAHLARSMMFEDLSDLLTDDRIECSRDELVAAIEHENVLGKRSVRSRKLTARHLISLYSLNPSLPIYHAMLYLWQRSTGSRPQLALLTAYVRDRVLRDCTPFVQMMQPGDLYRREILEVFIDKLQPGRFSKSTLESVAQHVATTWTHAGLLVGGTKKSRQVLQPDPAAVAFALLLSFVRGDRGELMFESEYVKLLDCSTGQAMELAEAAGARGWINFKRIGSIVEVEFPRLLINDNMSGAGTHE